MIVPVFTAHPTEVARRSVMLKRRRIGEFLATLDRIPVPPQDLERLEELIRAEVTSLWQTDEVRSRRPTVYDEIKMGLDYYDVSIFLTLPSLYREIAEALKTAYGLESGVARTAAGSSLWLLDRRRPGWQPFCDPAGDARFDSSGARAFAAPLPEPVGRIVDLLTSSAQQMPVSEALLERLQAYVSQIHTPEAQVFGEQYEFEYYRRFILCLKARIQRTMVFGEHPDSSSAPLPVTLYALSQGQDKLAQALPAYCSVEEFVADLETLRSSLAANRGLRIARTLVDPLLIQVRTFGLHLHTLDIRQHAKVHTAALQEAIGDTMAPALQGSLSADTANVLDTFRAVAEIKSGCSPERFVNTSSVALPRWKTSLP